MKVNEVNTMDKFNGFTTKDLHAFEQHKCRRRAYNDERKIVWEKLRLLKTELDGLMPLRMDGAVSNFWPGKYNHHKVGGLWLGYSHNLPLRKYPHLEVWIDDESVWVGLTIPVKAKKFQRRLKNYILENRTETLKELRELPAIKNAEFNMDDKSVDFPRDISGDALQKFAEAIEPGEGYLSIGYWFSYGDGRLKTRGFIKLAAKLLTSLYPFYKHALEGPDKSVLANLIASQQRAKKTRRRYRKIGEGKEHKRLKEYLGKHPERLERGLEFECEEFCFYSGDRADLLFRDAFRNFVVVEVEPRIEKGEIVGLLQAIKYKYMLAVQGGINFRNVRAFLVAKRIHGSIKRLAKRYGVTTKEIEL